MTGVVRRDVVESSLIPMNSVPMEWNAGAGTFYELNLRMCHLQVLQYAFTWPTDTSSGFMELKSLPNPTRILSLDLGVNDLTSLESNQLVMFSQLRVLNASLNRISRFTGVEVLRRLVSLDLSHNDISHISTELANCQSLVKLDLSVNRIDHITLMPHLNNLQVLQIHHNKLTSLNGVQNLPMLRELYAQNNRLVDLNHIETCAYLTMIDCSSNDIQMIEPVVKTLNRLPQLQSLCLYNNPVSKAESYEKSLVGNTTITSLDGVRVKNRSQLVQGQDYRLNYPQNYGQNYQENYFPRPLQPYDYNQRAGGGGMQREALLEQRKVRYDYRSPTDVAGYSHGGTWDGQREDGYYNQGLWNELSSYHHNGPWLPLTMFAKRAYHEHLEDKRRAVDDNVRYLNRQAADLQSKYDKYESHTLDDLNYCLKYLSSVPAYEREGLREANKVVEKRTLIQAPPRPHIGFDYSVAAPTTTTTTTERTVRQEVPVPAVLPVPAVSYQHIEVPAVSYQRVEPVSRVDRLVVEHPPLVIDPQPLVVKTQGDVYNGEILPFRKNVRMQLEPLQITNPSYTKSMEFNVPTYSTKSVEVNGPAYTRSVKMNGSAYTNAVEFTNPTYTKSVEVNGPAYNTKSVEINAPTFFSKPFLTSY